MRIALIYGGDGNEAEISIMSKNCIRTSLDKLGYQNIVEYNFDKNIIPFLQKEKPDIVFNAMHGKWGEDGCLPLLCDFLNIPYTHSDHDASVIAMNKELTKEIAKSLGIKVCESRILTKNDVLNHKYQSSQKLFLKPYAQGSSRSSFIVHQNTRLSQDQLQSIVDNEAQFYIIEEFFDGKTVDVAVLDNKAIGAIEVVPKNEFYDYQSKYTDGMSEYFVPPRIDSNVLEEILHLTEILHSTIGAKCVSRSDFIVSENDYRFLELNTHPGMTDLSLVPKIAENIGISYEQIVQILIQNANFNR